MDDWRTLYPFRSHYLPLDGPRMHYLDEGSGSPLLLVHGNPTWSFYWRNIVQGLRDQFRIVVPDHIGCGLSDKPQQYPYSLRQHTDNLLRLAESLDLRDVTLLAHDWGGAIGLGTVVRLRERFSRIVLFNTGAFPPPFIPLRIRLCRIPLLGTVAIRGLNAFARAAISMATEKPERISPAVKAGLLAPYDSWTNRVAIDRFVRDIPASPSHPTWHDLEALEKALPRLELPVLLVWGMRDWCFTPQCLDRFVDLFPHAEVHRLEDAGHYVIEDAHERIVPLVREFLGRSS